MTAFTSGSVSWETDVSGSEHARVGPDGVSVVGTCCEPAAGRVVVVAADGAVVDVQLYGIEPVLSPDGVFVAGLYQPAGVTTAGIDGRTPGTFVISETGEGLGVADLINTSGLAWSYTGDMFAFTYDSATDLPVLVTLSTDADELTDGTIVGPAPDGLAWVSPAFTSAGLAVVEVAVPSPMERSGSSRIVIVDPATSTEVSELAVLDQPVVDLDTDPSGSYLIYVLEDGSVHYVGVDGTAGALTSEGFVSASW